MFLDWKSTQRIQYCLPWKYLKTNWVDYLFQNKCVWHASITHWCVCTSGYMLFWSIHIFFLSYFWHSFIFEHVFFSCPTSYIVLTLPSNNSVYIICNNATINFYKSCTLVPATIWLSNEFLMTDRRGEYISLLPRQYWYFLPHISCSIVCVRRFHFVDIGQNVDLPCLNYIDYLFWIYKNWNRATAL